MLTTGELARIFDRSPRTIRRWQLQGKIIASSTDPQGGRLFRRGDVTVLYLLGLLRQLARGRGRGYRG